MYVHRERRTFLYGHFVFTRECHRCTKSRSPTVGLFSPFLLLSSVLYAIRRSSTFRCELLVCGLGQVPWIPAVPHRPIRQLLWLEGYGDRGQQPVCSDHLETGEVTQVGRWREEYHCVQRRRVTHSFSRPLSCCHQA